MHLIANRKSNMYISLMVTFVCWDLLSMYNRLWGKRKCSFLLLIRMYWYTVTCISLSCHLLHSNMRSLFWLPPPPQLCLWIKCWIAVGKDNGMSFFTCVHLENWVLKVRRFLTFVVTLTLEHYIRNFEIPLLHFEGVCMVLVIKRIIFLENARCGNFLKQYL